MKIICDSDIPFLKGALEPYCEVVYARGSDIDNEMVADADALVVRTRTRCDASLLEGSKVRFIATATIGYAGMQFMVRATVYGFPAGDTVPSLRV